MTRPRNTADVPSLREAERLAIAGMCMPDTSLALTRSLSLIREAISETIDQSLGLEGQRISRVRARYSERRQAYRRAWHLWKTGRGPHPRDMYGGKAEWNRWRQEMELVETS